MILDLRKNSFLIPNPVIELILGMGARCIFLCQIHLYLWVFADATEEKSKPKPQVTHQVAEVVILPDPQDHRIIYSLGMAY